MAQLFGPDIEFHFHWRSKVVQDAAAVPRHIENFRNSSLCI